MISTDNPSIDPL